MAGECEKAGAIIDRDKLRVFPDPAGTQHCEVMAVRDLYPNWVPRCLRFSWKEEIRPDVSYGNCDSSVATRLQLSAVSKCGIEQPYRPEALRDIPEFASYYPQGVSIPDEPSPSVRSRVDTLVGCLSRGAAFARDKVRQIIPGPER